MKQINLFNIENYTIDTSMFSNLLHDKIVTDFENTICEYVGAKYACSINSATNAIFLMFLNKDIIVNIPSCIPPVVPNALITAGNKINFINNVKWVGDSYVLHDFGDYKIIDSAQKIEKDQFKKEANNNDLMFFSFYPTKPIGSCDGGMIVSNDKQKIDNLKIAAMNGMSFSTNNWERHIKFPGYKMYMNSIQAYIANENFKKLENKKIQLRQVREKYNKAFKLNNTSEHLYIINVLNRYELSQILKENGITTGIHYDSLHENGVYNKHSIHTWYSWELLESTNHAQRSLSIPYHEKLTNKDTDLIINIIKENGVFK